jgi:hypothetical protein
MASKPRPKGAAKIVRDRETVMGLALPDSPEVGRKLLCKALKSLISRKEKAAGEPHFGPL